MNESVLRGFCQKCVHAITMLDSGVASHVLTLYCTDKEIEPVWFLSVKQMVEVITSKQFLGWLKENGEGGDTDSLPIFLDAYPFLVAKILKESEKE